MKLQLIKRLEFPLFLGLLIFSSWSFIVNPLSPLTDEPTHLYNARLIQQYFSNETVNQYYHLQKTPMPNLFGHYSLALLDFVFDSAVSEKIMLLLYFILFAFGFRALVKAYAPQNIMMSLLAIPLSHSFLFYMGFYNYCISLAFLFFSLAWYYSRLYNIEKPSAYRYAVFFVLVGLTYFSGIIAYSVLLFVTGVYELRSIIIGWKHKRKEHIKRMLISGAVFLPTLFCTFLFFKSSNFYGSEASWALEELIGSLIDGKALIIYKPAEDMLYARILFIIIILLFAQGLIARLPDSRKYLFFGADIFLVLLVIVFFLYLKVPDNSSAGMMSHRLQLLLLIVMSLWTAMQKGLRFYAPLLLLMLIPQIMLVRVHSAHQKDFCQEGLKIKKAAALIPENSLVLIVNPMADWVFTASHFPDYIGIDKPMIILNNYEAFIPWFPMSWNKEKIPAITLNGKSSIAQVIWPTNLKSKEKKEIEYVFVYGDINELSFKDKWKELKVNLDSAFAMHYQNVQDKIFILKHR